MVPRTITDAAEASRLGVKVGATVHDVMEGETVLKTFTDKAVAHAYRRQVDKLAQAAAAAEARAARQAAEARAAEALRSFRDGFPKAGASGRDVRAYLEANGWTYSHTTGDHMIMRYGNHSVPVPDYRAIQDPALMNTIRRQILEKMSQP